MPDTQHPFRSVGADLIAAERQRQIDAEGWTPEHDASHDTDNELSYAAVAYALPERLRETNYRGVPRLWPWEARFWKPTPDDRVRELVKAGALIAAEIDHLRAAQIASSSEVTDA
jgi:hypothetical protein